MQIIVFLTLEWCWGQ